MRIQRFLTGFAILLFVLASAPVAAGETEAQMSPEEQAMMEKWQAYMTPGEPHAFLAKMAGQWEMKTKMWPGPGADPEESTGQAKMKMIMDGRYILEKIEGSFQGQPFHGMGITGYDNMKGEYWSTWVDSSGTAISYSRGTEDADGVLHMSGTWASPNTPEGRPYRTETHTMSDDEYRMDFYDSHPDAEGGEFMNMSMTYKRS